MAQVTTHLAYCNSNIPVTVFSSALDNGVVCYNSNAHDFSADKLIISDKYFKTTTETAETLLYTDPSSNIGSLSLPDKDNHKAFLISYEDEQYIWKDINDVVTTSYYTIDVNNDVNNKGVYEYVLQLTGSSIEDMSKYEYVVMLDLDIFVTHVSDINEIVKNGEELFVTINTGTSFNSDILNSTDNLYKNAVNVTSTTSPSIHVTKILQGCKFLSNQIELYLTLQKLNTTNISMTENIYDNANNDIKIIGTVTLFQYLTQNSSVLPSQT